MVNLTWHGSLCWDLQACPATFWFSASLGFIHMPAMFDSLWKFSCSQDGIWRHIGNHHLEPPLKCWLWCRQGSIRLFSSARFLLDRILEPKYLSINICDFWVIIWMSPYTSAPILFRFTSFIKVLIKAAIKSTRAEKMVCLFIILDSY